MANQPKKYKKFVATAATATLVASAIVPVASAASLSDIAGNTHEEAINALVDAKVISGYPDGTFKPNKTLTRSDVVKLLGKYLETQGFEAAGNYKTSPAFKDLKTTSNEELLKYASVVKEAGVFAGSNGNLLAGDSITRENMAIVLVRMINTLKDVSLEEYVASQDFDGDVTDLEQAKAEARTAIAVLDFYDITNPAAPVFNPKGDTTRGQFASFLNKTINADYAGASATTGTVKAINNTTVEVTFGEAIADVKDLTFKIEGLEVKNAVVKQTDSKTAVLTTAVQEAGKEYTVSVNGDAIGKFTGISAVIPTGISVVERSQQGVIGQQVTVKAQVTVADGQTKAGIPVTFNVTGTGSLNTPQLFEATTDANGVATYTYTRYANTTDDVVAYATGDRTKFSTGKVYWSNAAQLTVKDVTTDTTLVNGAKKVYQIESSKNAGKYVFVTFAENLNVTPDKLTKNVVVEGVSTYTIKSDDSVGTDLGTSKYPYEVTTGGKAVTAVKLDSNGKANLVLTGSSASATPIVFEAPLKSTTSSTPGSVVTDFSDVTYNATALQAKASTVKFELKHSLGLTIEAQGVQDAALRNSDGIGGRDYVVTYTDKDGKVANSGTKVLVGIPTAGLSNASNVEVYDEDETRLNSVTSDSKYVYYNVTVGKEGKATFTVTSSKENDYIAPVAFINNGTSAGISLDDSDLQTTGAITYFVNKVEFAAKLKLTDGSKAAKSFVAGKETAHFQYVLVDQNGKTRKADADTEVSFEVYAGTAPLTIVGQGTVPAGSYKTVKAKVSKGSSTAEIRVNAVAPTEATVTATGSKAGIVLTSTDPASVTATFTQFATNAITGVSANINKSANTLTLVDNNGKAHVYSYDGATLLQNNNSTSEGNFEALVEQGARVTVSKDDAGKLTFNIIQTGVGLADLTAQQAVDVAIQLAVINNASAVTVEAKGNGNIVVDTDADLDITVKVNSVNNLTIDAANAENISIVADGAGLVSGGLTVDAPNAHVTVASGIQVVGTTNIVDVDDNSFVNSGILANVNISDANGARFVNNGTVGTVTVSGSGSVEIGGNVSTVNVTGAATVTIPTGATVTTVNVLNENAKVEDKTGNTIVNDDNAVDAVDTLSFTDTDTSTNIAGQIRFDVTDALASGAEEFVIAVKGQTIATIDDSTKAAGDVITYTLTDVALAVGDKITVTAKNATGKLSDAEEVVVTNDQTGVPTVVSFASQTPFNTAAPFIDAHVKNVGGAQVATTAAKIQETLVAKLATLQGLSDDEVTEQGRDLTGLEGVTAADIKVNAGNIKFSDDGKTVYITGPVLSEKAFIVAKGGKDLAGKYNITLIDNSTTTPGEMQQVAKIVISADGSAKLEKITTP